MCFHVPIRIKTHQISFFSVGIVVIHHLFDVVLGFPDGRDAAIAVHGSGAGIVGCQCQGKFAFIAIQHLLKIHGSAHNVFPGIKWIVNIKCIKIFRHYLHQARGAFF